MVKPPIVEHFDKVAVVLLAFPVTSLGHLAVEGNNSIQESPTAMPTLHLQLLHVLGGGYGLVRHYTRLLLLSLPLRLHFLQAQLLVQLIAHFVTYYY